MRWFIERVVSEGSLIIINIGVGPLLISEGSPYKISIVGVGPIDIHRRVVH